jgi:asparagine synthase (glutamine-hydrolysing)
MRSLLAVARWPELAVPPEAWLAADAAGWPLALAHQGEAIPVATNEHGTIRAVLAGAVYNARQLRFGLGARHALSGRDDAEVVVHLYEERGVQCVKALRGAFAFVLWDERRQRLLLACDQLGLVPLYYATDGPRLAAASALPALTRLPHVAGSWDPAALDAFLTLGTVPPPATFHTAIRRLGPGELALWEDGRLRTQRYWQLTFPERRMTRPDVPALLREQMLEAVRLRQTGVVSGLLLSGGLDAAAILALAAADRHLPLRTYTAAVVESGDQEVRAAADLAARVGVEHVAVTGEQDWVALVDALLAAHGGPVGTPALAALGSVARRAAGEVDVLLSGLGGEEVFGGSAPARAAERVRRYRELPGVAREGAQMWARLAPARWTAALRRVVEDQRLAPVEMYARGVSVMLPEEREDLYTADTFAALGEANPWDAVATLFAEAVSGGASETLDTIHYVELTLGLPARVAAAAAATAGIDLRLPLADHRLAQFVASVPAAHRGDAAERQLLLRRALGDLLPSAVARRPHASPGPPPHAWGALLEETLSPTRLAAHGFFRPETVARLREEHTRRARDHAELLWRIVVTTRWLERQIAPSLPAVQATG